MGAVNPSGQSPELSSWGLATGWAGKALFIDTLARATGETHWRGHADDLAERCVEAVGGQPMTWSFFGGVTGLAWALEALGATRGEDVEEALVPFLADRSQRLPLDLVQGLCGYGVFLLGRLPGGRAREGLCQVLARLEERAERGPGMARWLSAPEELRPDSRALFPQGMYDLGMAHGVAGTIALLARIAEADVEPSRTMALLRDAVAWFLSRRLDRTENQFPAVLGPNSEPGEPARTAWCYGDAGASLALDRKSTRLNSSHSS